MGVFRNLAGLSDNTLITGLNYAPAWGTIVGTLSDQEDLQAALDAKSATTHTHEGTAILATGVTDGFVLTATGAGASAWEAAAGGGSGLFTEDANLSIFGGTGAGAALTTGSENFLAGAGTGALLQDGNQNTAVGDGALSSAVSVTGVVAVGRNSAENLTGGNYSVYLGHSSGQNVVVGLDNVFVGDSAGFRLNGTSSGNIILGDDAGPTVLGAYTDELYIHNSRTDTPIIHGDMTSGSEALTINGKVRVNDTGQVLTLRDDVSAFTLGAFNAAMEFEDVNNTNVGGLGYTSVSDNILYLSNLMTNDGIAIEAATGTEISVNRRFQIIQGGVQFAERADHSFTPATAKAELWVKNDATQALVFTDEATTDKILTPREGSWTPAFEYGGSATGNTYGLQAGSYIRQGNLVTAWYNVLLTAKGTGVGDWKMTGLPFTVDSGSDQAGGGGALTYWANTDINMVYMGLATIVDTTTAFFVGTSAAAAQLADLSNSYVSNTTVVRGCLVYKTSDA